MSIGNPWGAAAQSYGQDLDQLTKIQMGGMQQAAQMPLQLYDRFMDGYEKARQRAAQEKQMEMQQAQLDRQNRLADLQFQKDTENEAYRRRQENLKLVLDANKDITATGKEIGLDYTPDMRERFKAQLVDPLMQKGLPKLDAQLRAEKLLPALKATPIPNVQINEGEEAVPLLPSDYRVGQGFTGEDTFMGQRPAQVERQRKADELKDKQFEIREEGKESRAAAREERLSAEFSGSTRNITNAMMLLAAKGSNKKTADEILGDPATTLALEPWADLINAGGIKELPQRLLGDQEMFKALSRLALERRKGAELPPDATARYNADKTSAGKLTTNADAVAAFERLADANWGRYIEALKKTTNTGSPLLNYPIRKFQESVLGATEPATARSAGMTAKVETARLLTQPNMVGVLSDSARKEVENFDPVGATPDQAQAVYDLLKKEFTQRRQEVEAQSGKAFGRIRGGQGQSSPAGRIKVKDKNGVVGHIPASQLEQAKNEGYVEVP